MNNEQYEHDETQAGAAISAALTAVEKIQSERGLQGDNYTTLRIAAVLLVKAAMDADKSISTALQALCMEIEATIIGIVSDDNPNRALINNSHFGRWARDNLATARKLGSEAAAAVTRTVKVTNLPPELRATIEYLIGVRKDGGALCTCGIAADKEMSDADEHGPECPIRRSLEMLRGAGTGEPPSQ